MPWCTTPPGRAPRGTVSVSWWPSSTNRRRGRPVPTVRFSTHSTGRTPEPGGSAPSWASPSLLLVFGQHGRASSKAGRALNEGGQPLGGCVEDPVDAIGIIKALPKGPIRPGKGPVGPRPWICPPAHPVNEGGEVGPLHPPTRKARAAPSTAGPTSSRSPSAGNRAGERSRSAWLVAPMRGPGGCPGLPRRRAGEADRNGGKALVSGSGPQLSAADVHRAERLESDGLS
jgi:hypothetical protein